MVIISNCLKQSGKQEEFMQNINSHQFLEIEQNLLGYNQFEVLEHLFEHWNFEETMVQVVHYLNSPTLPKELQIYIYPLRVLNALINPYEIASEAQILKARNLVQQYQLDLASFDTTLEDMRLNPAPTLPEEDYPLVDE